MGGKRTLANGPDGRDCLATVSPVLKRRREPTRFSSAELHRDIVASGMNYKLEAIWTGRADLESF